MSRARRWLPLALVLLLLLLLGGGGVFVVGFLDASGDGVAGGVHGTDGESPGHGTSGRRGKREHVQRGGTEEGDGPGSGGETTTGVGAGEGESGEQPEGTGGTAGKVPPGADEDEHETVSGRVVDSESGAAVAGARILVVRRDHGWYGTRTGDDGAFEAQVPDDTGDGALVELRIAKPGYRTVVVPWTEGPVAAQLIADDHVPQPGVVVGLATDGSGHPLTGRVLLTTYDEMGDHHGLWVMADAAGAFRMEGVAPGWWQMSIYPGGRATPVVVPDGGATRAHLVTSAEPWPGTMTEEEFKSRLAELSEGIPPGETDETVPEQERERLRQRRIMAVQDLECRWRAIQPAREVVVTGLGDVPACLRAASTQGPRHSWRVRVVDGSARFPALTAETWRLVLEVPGAAAVARSVTVPAGTEPFDVAWGAAGRE